MKSKIDVVLKLKRPWVVITAYDAPTAALLDQQSVDMILVGDSVGTVLLGYSSTREVSLDEMIHHSKAVLRGSKSKPVVGDLPFKALRGTDAEVMRRIVRYMRIGLDAVKIEWSSKAEKLTRQCVKRGMPVMGHVGLTPQDLKPGEKFRVRGSTKTEADRILRQALAFQAAGAFALVLECIPSSLGRSLTRVLRIPTIGIGAGPDTSAQVLVFHDIVGLTPGFKPRFLKQYTNAWQSQSRAIAKFIQDVRRKRYPSKSHGYK
jgi:3-methyl-2-oxobutanoate hydroxymethyltransferase